jgi:hypothetical protein
LQIVTGATFTRKWNKIQQEREGNTMRSSKANAFALYLMGVFVFALWLSGCGGGGASTIGTGSTPAPTVTVSASPTSITAGQSSTLTITTGSATSCTGTDSLAGTTVPLNATGTVVVKPTVTSTYSVNCTGPGGSNSASATVTVTAAPPTVTSVTVTATPTSITTTQTAQVTAVVAGTGSFSSAVTWTATGGTISGTGNTVTLTPSGVGTATATATSTQTGYTTVSGSASIAVTQAPPVITGISPAVYYLDGQGEGYFEIDGTGFAGGDTVSITTPGSLLSVSLTGTTKIQVMTRLESAFYSPGWFGFKVCEADGVTCSNTEYVAFIGNQNTLAIGPDGELYQNDQAQGNTGINDYNDYVRKFKVANGVATADGSIATSLMQSIPVDNKTGYNTGGGVTLDANGNLISIAANDGNGSGWVGEDANNGLSCGTRPNGSPTANLLSCYPVGVPNAPLNSVTLGTEPWTVAMGTFNSTTYAFVYSRKTTPMLWKVKASTATLVGSYAPTGFTDSATIFSSSYLAGWEVVVFQSGPLSGTVAILSNYDKVLIFVNTTTMAQIGQPITLTGNPFRIAKDETNGKVVVEFADFTNATTPKSTFASVSPSAITPAVYVSTSLNLGAGFAVSPDGKYLYVCQRASCDVQPNK